MRFNSEGKLEIDTCACGVASIDDLLVNAEYLKQTFGNRDIIFFQTVGSRTCAEKYPGRKADITRESCMYYN